MDRRLIIHADDVGMCESITNGCLKAISDGVVTSLGIMVTCPDSERATDEVIRRPGLDIGLHLTLTSEWPRLRWTTAVPGHQVPSLIDPDGFLWPTVASFIKHATIRDVEREIREQLRLLRSTRLVPSHIDCHMGAVFARNDLTNIYRSIAREHGLGYVTPSSSISLLRASRDKGDTRAPQISRNKVFEVIDGDGDWLAAYVKIVSRLPVGICQLIVHPGSPGADLDAMAADVLPWGARWREKDLNLLTGLAFREALKERRIELVDWKRLRPLGNLA
jgi:chitin disaccharide deacetylase